MTDKAIEAAILEAVLGYVQEVEGLEEYPEPEGEDLQKFKELISRIIKAYEAAKGDGWINVVTAKPDHGDVVQAMVYLAEANDTKVYAAWYDEKMTEWVLYGEDPNEIFLVTHWRPLEYPKSEA
jgi:hypothetical protein